MSPGKPRLSRKVASSNTTAAETQAIPQQADAFALPPSALSEVAAGLKPRRKVTAKPAPAPAFDAAAVAAAIFAGVAAMGHVAPAPKARRKARVTPQTSIPLPEMLAASPEAVESVPEPTVADALPERPRVASSETVDLTERSSRGEPAPTVDAPPEANLSAPEVAASPADAKLWEQAQVPSSGTIEIIEQSSQDEPAVTVGALPEENLSVPEVAATAAADANLWERPRVASSDTVDLTEQSSRDEPAPTVGAPPEASSEVAAATGAKPRKRAAPRAKTPVIVAIADPVVAPVAIEPSIATTELPVAAPIELPVVPAIEPHAPAIEPVVEAAPPADSAPVVPSSSPAVLKLSLTRKTAVQAKAISSEPAPMAIPAPPAEKVTPPAAKIERPAGKVERHPPKVERHAARVERHAPKVETPAAKVETPAAGIEIPVAKIETLTVPINLPPPEVRETSLVVAQETSPAIPPESIARTDSLEPAPIPRPIMWSTEPFSPPMSVVHRMHPIALGRKREVLQLLLAQTPDRPSLVYTRTKHGADKIARFLERAGFKAAAIHGDKSHGARARALAGFKSGDLNALVITDIAARLLDVHGLPSVLNYDLPHIADDYSLRVLRTGSATTPGLSITIITQEESVQFRAVRDLLQCPIELLPLAGFEAAEPFDPERDPIVRAEPESSGDEVAAAAPVAAPEVKREDGRIRRDRRGRPIREPRVREVAAVPEAAPVAVGVEGEVAADAQPIEAARPARPPRVDRHADRKARGERPPRTERPAREGVAPREAAPRTERPARTERPVRADRKLRADRPFRGDRQPRAPRGDEQPLDDRQPFFDTSPLPMHDDDEDGPAPGNSLAAPPPSQINANIAGRRRGRRDPFATVVIDEDQANIYDERQPDSFRDQWSVLGPDTNRPSWTYAEHEPQLVIDSIVRPTLTRTAPVGRRKGPPSGPGRAQPSGQARGPQRPRPRRAEGR